MTGDPPGVCPTGPQHVGRTKEGPLREREKQRPRSARRPRPEDGRPHAPRRDLEARKSLEWSSAYVSLLRIPPCLRCVCFQDCGSFAVYVAFSPLGRYSTLLVINDCAPNAPTRLKRWRVRVCVGERPRPECGRRARRRVDAASAQGRHWSGPGRRGRALLEGRARRAYCLLEGRTRRAYCLTEGLLEVPDPRKSESAASFGRPPSCPYSVV